MTRDELLDLFRRSGALLEGHFRLTSGLHSPGYLQCALVLQHPQHAEALGRALADATRALGATVVLSPALGGIVIGQEVGRALGVRAHLRRAAGRHADAAARLHAAPTRSRARRRGRADDRRIDARDDGGGEGRGRAGRRRRVDRRSQRRHGRVRRAVHALLEIALPTYHPSACPLCAQGLAGR